MDNGMVGGREQISRSYRCYVVFLRNETDLPTPAEKYIMRHFWEVANSVGNEVLFTGIVSGEGHVRARRDFGITNPTQSVIVLLDISPSVWKRGRDPLAVLPLNALRSEFEILEFLHLLVTITKSANFIGKVNRKKTFENIKKYIGYVPKIADYAKYLVPGVS